MLDQYCISHRETGSPERLQAHLAELFPDSYRPPTEPTAATTPASRPGPVGRKSAAFVRRVLGLE